MRLDDRARRAADGIRRAVDPAESAPPGHDPLDRFRRFQRRKARNQRIGVLVITVAIAAGGFLAWRALERSPHRPANAPTGTIVFGEWNAKIQQAHWFTVSADGSNLHDLGIEATCAQWWPDGSRIFVTNDAAVDRDTPLRPATIRADGTGLMPLDAARDADLNLGCGDVSPDQTRIALEGFGPGATGVNGIYTVRSSDGGDLTRITHGHDSYPQYGPDGRRVVFFRTKPGIQPNGAGALFVVDVDGTGLRRITPWGFTFLQSAWSPDGRWIVFERPYGELYLVHPDGSGTHPLPVHLPPSAGATTPQWSPDGEWIAFTLQQGRNANLYIVRPDGSGLRAITHVQGATEASPDWAFPIG